MMEEIGYILDEIEGLYNKSVLVIGDVFLDEYDFGNVTTVSTGIRVPIVETEMSKYSLGGAGNVVANISALTSKTFFLTQYANDESGRKINQLLKKYNISIQCFPANRSISKKRVYIDHQQVLRLDQNEYTHINHNMISEVIRKNKCDVIVVADYSFGMVDQFVLNCCKEKSLCDDIPLIFSSRRIENFDTSGISLIVVNEKDATNLIDTDGNLQKKIKEDIIITRGSLGIKAYINHETYEATAFKDLPVNVSGAGDTVLAIVSLFYQSRINIETYLYLANIAAGIAIKDELTYRLQKEDLIAYLFELDCMRTNCNKCVSLHTAKIIVNAWKKQGHSIILIDECVNPLESKCLMAIEKDKKINDNVILTININKADDKNNFIFGGLDNQSIFLSFVGLFNLIIIRNTETMNFVADAISPDVYYHNVP